MDWLMYCIPNSVYLTLVMYVRLFSYVFFSLIYVVVNSMEWTLDNRMKKTNFFPFIIVIKQTTKKNEIKRERPNHYKNNE